MFSDPLQHAPQPFERADRGSGHALQHLEEDSTAKNHVPYVLGCDLPVSRHTPVDYEATHVDYNHVLNHLRHIDMVDHHGLYDFST